MHANLIYGLVKEKYSLDPETQIYFEDDHGAEVDPEIFPIFLDQQVIPDLVLKIEGEEQPVIYRKSRSTSSTTKILRNKNLWFKSIIRLFYS